MFRFAICLLVWLWVVAPAVAEQRVALVIGNGAYSHVPQLPNPLNDARDIAGSMQRLGFAVSAIIDANFDAMRKGLNEFGRRAKGADIAVIFFAGHGMEIGGENWLIPVDAELHSDNDAEGEAISLRAAMLQVAGATKLGLVILDACRNNPFAVKMQGRSRTRAVERGFARTEPTDNVLVAYAARDGTTANDGNGRNSPFSAALLRNLETPGIEVRFLFAKVRDDVMAATRREQQPFVYGSLSSDAIYLRPPATGSVPPAAAPAPSPNSDEIAWNYLSDTTSIAALRRFLAEYPATSRGRDALARIAVLEQQEKEGKRPEPGQGQSALAPPAAIAPSAETTKPYARAGNLACFNKAEFPEIWRAEAPLCTPYGCNFGKMSEEACLALGVKKRSRTVIHGNLGTTRSNECWLQHSCRDLRPHGEFTMFKM